MKDNYFQSSKSTESGITSYLKKTKNNNDNNSYTAQKTALEDLIWSGSPSQWANIYFYLLCAFVIPIYGFGLFLILWKFLDTYYHKITITTQRIIERRGILSRHTNEIELYRVKDLRHDQPVFLRIFSLSNILLNTTDHNYPEYKIEGVSNGASLREQLRQAIDIRRDIKGVRELDVG
jgi:uncharacterized membrane protein YdbT with pleckstrin-like domain